MTKLQICGSVNDLKQWVTTAAASADEDMLRCVGNKLDYRTDICRVTNTHAAFVTYSNTIKYIH
jgi:hypothetical protein